MNNQIETQTTPFIKVKDIDTLVKKFINFQKTNYYLKTNEYKKLSERQMRKVKYDKAIKCSVIQYDLECKKIKTWSSVSQAAVVLGISPYLICLSMKFPRKTAGGYHWVKTIEILEGEIWKKYHPSYPGIKVSNKGRVQIDKEITYGNLRKNGYHYVCIFNATTGCLKTEKVDRLVCSVFNSRDKGNFVIHLDKNRQNNKVENLRWYWMRNADYERQKYYIK